MTEKGRGGGKWVETFEVHEITSLPTFRAPKSCERTGTYSTCVLGVLLRCQHHDQLVFRAQSEGWLTGVLSIFSHFGFFCNFNIIFNLVVGPICGRNLHRQPLHQSKRLVETLLLIELVVDMCIFHGTMKFWKTLCNLAEFIKKGGESTKIHLCHTLQCHNN